MLCGVAAPASAQIFLASRPHPQFTVGPVIVLAIVPQDLGTVQVNLSWSLSVPPGRQPPPTEDIFLLWPREVASSTVPGAADPDVVRYVETRGLQVLGSGRLALRSRDRARVGTGNLGDPLEVQASYATFIRTGFPQLGAGTYIKIPWTPKLADPLSIMTLGLRVKDMIAPRPASWFSELFWGRRYILTSSFGDAGQIALSLCPIDFERRDHVIHLARDFSLIAASFPDADHLRIEEISPSGATRRGSRVRAGTETVSLLLLALGNVMGTIMLGKSIGGLLRRWLWFGRPARPPARHTGSVIAPDTLRGIEPGASTLADVLQRCGPPQEERQRAGGRQRMLVYRGVVVTTHKRFGVGWFATVSHREVEHHEVVFELEDDRVRDVEGRIGRTGAA